MNKEKWQFILITLLSVFFGCLMINSGLNKFLQYMAHPPLEPKAKALMMAFTTAGYMWPLVAITEISGGLMVILKKTRAVGAIVLMPISVNVFALDLFLNLPMLMIGVMVLLLNVVILASEYKRLLFLVQSETTRHQTPHQIKS